MNLLLLSTTWCIVSMLDTFAPGRTPITYSPASPHAAHSSPAHLQRGRLHHVLQQRCKAWRACGCTHASICNVGANANSGCIQRKHSDVQQAATQLHQSRGHILLPVTLTQHLQHAYMERQQACVQTSSSRPVHLG